MRSPRCGLLLPGRAWWMSNAPSAGPGATLGVPVEIVRKNKPLRKGKIVTLCDVSGSVWSTARFMLNILYSLQVCFARVKSYIFIEQPLEVSNYFLNNDANDAAKKILQDTRINYNARTDYGLVFQEFRDHHLGDLDKKNHPDPHRRRPVQLSQPPGTGAGGPAGPLPATGVAKPRAGTLLGHRGF